MFLPSFSLIFFLIGGSMSCSLNQNPQKIGRNELVFEPLVYDIVIKNGQLINTENKTRFFADIGILDGKIAKISPEINSGQGLEIIDASNLIVTPGLIDLHTHINWGSSYWGIEPEPIASITGVTTWVDAGSTGAYNFPGFLKNVIKKSPLKIFAFLHISAIGLTGRTYEGSAEFLDEEMSNYTITQNPDIIKGIKVRIDKDASGGSTLPLEKAKNLAKFHKIPVMVHIAKGPPGLEEITNFLEQGDIITHAYTGQDNKLIDDNGQPLAIVQELKNKGIIFDIGHGSGSFSFKSAQGLIENGILPDTISSDIHQVSRVGPMFDLPTTLSKFLSLGMTLEEVVTCATLNPAKILGQEDQLGVIREGSVADLAIFELKEGDFTFKDSADEERHGQFLLSNKMTLVNGQVMKRSKELLPHPWVSRDLDIISRFEEKC